MYFELEVAIERKPAEVFAFMRDKDLYPQKPGSKVLALEKLTPGRPGVGTRYREVVRMLPFFRGTILSEITRFEVPYHLEESFAGAGMRVSGVRVRPKGCRHRAETARDDRGERHLADCCSAGMARLGTAAPGEAPRHQGGTGCGLGRPD